MTLNEVKKAIMAWPGVEIEGKLKAKTVDFTDLARCKGVFLEVNFAKEPDWDIYREMKAFCKDAGIVLTNSQMWIPADTGTDEERDQ